MPALFAGMRVRSFFGDRRRSHQFRAYRRVEFSERVDNFPWRVLGHDVSRIGLSVGIFEGKFLSGGKHLTVSQARGDQDAPGNQGKTGGRGGSFWHKKRPISSKIAALATAFFKKITVEMTLLQNTLNGR
ncbi:MAG TPA: hypothetical protein VJ721_09200, partial [Chthoniobacterales bacterium]|nr:hypothetical protein [Chthoniobacterales bacterium]